jgi:DDE family transposase
VRRDISCEENLVAKYAAIAGVLDERARRVWAASESRAIGYGGDALVSAATGLARATIRKGRQELDVPDVFNGRLRRAGAGRPALVQVQPGIKEALEQLVDPLTRGDPMSPLRWTCKSKAKLAAAMARNGWKVSATKVGRLLHELVL